MKKVELVAINRMNGDLYHITYTVNGKTYYKNNVRISLYGYAFDEVEGVDDFNIMINVETKA